MLNSLKIDIIQIFDCVFSFHNRTIFTFHPPLAVRVNNFKLGNWVFLAEVHLGSHCYLCNHKYQIFSNTVVNLLMI